MMHYQMFNYKLEDNNGYLVNAETLTNYNFAMTLVFFHCTYLSSLLPTKNSFHEGRDIIRFVHYIIPSRWVTGW